MSSPDTNTNNFAAHAVNEIGSVENSNTASENFSSTFTMFPTRQQHLDSLSNQEDEHGELIEDEDFDPDGEDDDDSDDDDNDDSDGDDDDDDGNDYFDLDDDEDDDFEVNPVIERQLKIMERKALEQNVILPWFSSIAERYHGIDVGDFATLTDNELSSIEDLDTASKDIDKIKAVFLVDKHRFDETKLEVEPEVWIDFEEIDLGEDDEDDMEANSVDGNQLKVAEEQALEQDVVFSPVRQAKIIEELPMRSRSQEDHPAYEAESTRSSSAMPVESATISAKARPVASEDNAKHASDRGRNTSGELFTTQDPLALWEQVLLAPWDVDNCAEAIYTMLKRIRSYEDFTPELLQREWAMAVAENWYHAILDNIKRAAEAEFWKDKREEREKVVKKFYNQMGLV